MSRDSLEALTPADIAAMQDEVTRWHIPRPRNLLETAIRLGKSDIVRVQVGLGYLQALGRDDLGTPYKRKAKGYRKHVRNQKQETRRCTK